jgi:cell division protein FtsI (penicillin-binding protein 3)
MDEKEYESSGLEFSMRRVRRLTQFTLLWAVIILLRLVQLQILRHAEFRRLADAQHEHLVKVELPRGAIFDRNGQRLAMSLPVDSVYVNPLQIHDVGVASEILAKILNLDQQRLINDMNDAVAARRGFLWIKRKLDPEESARLRSLDFDWISFEQESRRFYPYGEFAAQVIGTVGTDEGGLEGVELKLNKLLAAHVGMVRVSWDPRHQSFAQQLASDAPQAGQDVHLSIDSRLQYIAERELKRTITEHHCWNGSVVVMDPRTGEILAMASYPTFDPNVPPQKGDDPKARFNNAVSVPFEPGSVFKVVTLTAALETTNLRPDSVIPCGNGVLHMFGRTIHDHESYGALPMWGVLAHSSNIGAIQIGLKVGKENLYDYVRRFGFGQRSGLPLPGDARGLVRPPKQWQATSIASVSMGHEVMVTTVQLARACSVIANGGYLVTPHLLMNQQVDEPRRVIKAGTAFTMRGMMEGVVLHGTGGKARLQGYSTAGKTGTAQIAIDGKYTHLYNSSFMGFAPVANPAVVIVVTASGATGHDGFGAEVSAPVFKTVGEAALRYLDIPRDLPDSSPDPDTRKVDDNDLAIADLAPAPLAPPEEALDPEAESEGQRADFSDSLLAAPKVPNFVGLTVRAVMQEATADGIPVMVRGHGVARAQAPLAGTMLPAGEKVRIEFSD